MIFIKDSNIYAKVWKVTKSDKYIDLRISTSEKDSEGGYVNSNWFPRLIGHAFNSLKDTIKEGDKIIITKAKLSNENYKTQDGVTKSAFRFIILEANIADADETSASNSGEVNTAPQQTQTTTNDSCPW